MIVQLQSMLLILSLPAIAAFQPSTSWIGRPTGYDVDGPRTDASTSSLYMSIPTPLDTLTSGIASICRLAAKNGGGVTVASLSSSSSSSSNLSSDATRPQLTVLYDIENNASCRKVRERITELDLVILNVVPACANSRIFTDPKAQYSIPVGTTIPRLVVTVNKQERILSGEDQILTYLDETFGVARSKKTNVEESSAVDIKDQALEVLADVGNVLAGFVRFSRGTQVIPAALGAKVPRPSKILVLYSYEGNQFCRLVREVMTELDLMYELRSAGKLSPRRDELATISGGSTQCPYLLDPNKDVSMAESKDIIRYLYQTYALWTPPNEILQWASNVILPPAKPLFKVLAPLQAGSNREDKASYQSEISKAKAEIERTVKSSPVVVYTYDLSPFSFETKALLDNLNVVYKEISLGAEWIPGLIQPGGSQTRASLLEMTGQSSLPHIFIGGKSIGGLFSGNPGLVPALEQGIFEGMLSKAQSGRKRLESASIFE